MVDKKQPKSKILASWIQTLGHNGNLKTRVQLLNMPKQSLIIPNQQSQDSFDFIVFNCHDS